jgi:hypothetical protein
MKAIWHRNTRKSAALRRKWRNNRRKYQWRQQRQRQRKSKIISARAAKRKQQRKQLSGEMKDGNGANGMAAWRRRHGERQAAKKVAK